MACRVAKALDDPGKEKNMNPRLIGYAFAILGVLIISPDSALIRKIAMNPWGLLFWRGVGIFGVAAVLSLIWYRGGLIQYFRQTGKLGLAITVFFFISTCSFVYSALTINPIILLIVVALGPVSGAVFSIILLREPPRRAVWIAIALSFVGMGLVVWGEMEANDGFARLAAGEGLLLPPWPSMLALFFVPTLLGLCFTLTRRIEQPNIWPSNALAGLLAMVIMPFFAPTLEVPAGVFWEFAFLIIAVSGFSFIFVTLAPRWISSAETSLVFLLETLLGSIWIWLLIGQQPELHEIAGGAVVGLAVVVVVLSAVRSKAEPSPSPRPAAEERS